MKPERIYEAFLFMLLGAALLSLFQARADIRETQTQITEERRLTNTWMAATKASCEKAGIRLPDIPGEE